jgi:hypothetical protein
MSALTRNTVLALLTSLSLIVVTSAAASQPKAVLIAPPHDHCFDLPKFGFSSFNVDGFGEQVTFVRWGGRASRMGLEPGDIIVSLNGFPLTYHGSWNDALRQAVNNGGWVQIVVRDVRTGDFAYRQTFIGNGGIVPVTPHVVAHSGHFGGNYNGPITKKSMPVAPKLKFGTPEQLQNLADLIGENNNP